MALAKDLTGHKFHRLTVESKGITIKRHARWNCVCECGNKKVVCGTALKSGRTKSCGCFRTEALNNYQKNRALNMSGESNLDRRQRIEDEATREKQSLMTGFFKANLVLTLLNTNPD